MKNSKAALLIIIVSISVVANLTSIADIDQPPSNDLKAEKQEFPTLRDWYGEVVPRGEGGLALVKVGTVTRCLGMEANDILLGYDKNQKLQVPADFYVDLMVGCFKQPRSILLSRNGKIVSLQVTPDEMRKAYEMRKGGGASYSVCIPQDELVQD